MEHSLPHTGLVLGERPKKAWVAGSGKVTAKFGGADLNPSGDWTASIPPFEAQSIDGFDPESCALIHTMRAWITAARFQGFDDFLPNGSERYLGSFCGTSEAGTDPYFVADETRTYCGLVPQEIMPWNGESSFPTYYDKAMAVRNLPFGRALLDRFDLGHQDLWGLGAPLTPKEKAALIDTYLKKGPVCVSISGNYRTKKGSLYKNPGDRDTHWVQLAQMDTISDSYLPQFRKLAPEYDHEMATVYFVQRRDPSTNTFWDKAWRNFGYLWRGLKH